jgi:tight adherence protein B
MTLILIAGFIFALIMAVLGVFLVISNRRSPTDRVEEYMKDSFVGTVEARKTQEKKISGIRKAIRNLENIRLFSRIAAKHKKNLIQADILMTAEEFMVLRLIVSLVSMFVLALLSRQMVFGILGFGLGWFLPNFLVLKKKAKRTKVFNNQLGDALGVFANSLKAGYSYLQAVKSVAKEMPDPISREFGIVLKEMSLGLTVEDTLNGLLERVDSEDLSLMVTAILIQRETGGNLAEILENISETIRERIRLQGEIKTLTAQGRMSGAIIALMPFALAAFLQAANPEYFEALYTNLLGQILIGVALFNELMGILMIRKIINIDV